MHEFITFIAVNCGTKRKKIEKQKKIIRNGFLFGKTVKNNLTKLKPRRFEIEIIVNSTQSFLKNIKTIVFIISTH